MRTLRHARRAAEAPLAPCDTCAPQLLAILRSSPSPRPSAVVRVPRAHARATPGTPIRRRAHTAKRTSGRRVVGRPCRFVPPVAPADCRSRDHPSSIDANMMDNRAAAHGRDSRTVASRPLAQRTSSAASTIAADARQRLLTQRGSYAGPVCWHFSNRCSIVRTIIATTPFHSDWRRTDRAVEHWRGTCCGEVPDVEKFEYSPCSTAQA